jgi:hypothetical protein
MNRTLFLLVALLCSGPVVAQVRNCESQEASFNKANAAYEKVNTPAKKFFRSFREGGSSSSLSLATANMKTALDGLTACRDGQARDRQDEKDRAKQAADYAAYAATPEGKRRIAREKELNKVVDGRLDVASFTPRQFFRGVVDNPWRELANTDQTKYWYSYWIDHQMGGVFVMLKGADKGIGDNFTTVRFVSGLADCLRNPGIYPSYLMHTSVEVDDASTGYPPPGYSDVPMLGDVPLQRGTALAEAVKHSCDAVTQAH